MHAAPTDNLTGMGSALAAAAARNIYSSSHLRHVFRKMQGESLAAAQRRRRLDAAAAQLRSSPSRITDLALEAGYQSLEGFSRAFKKRFGVTPSAFLRQRTQHPRLALVSSLACAFVAHAERVSCDLHTAQRK